MILFHGHEAHARSVVKAIRAETWRSHVAIVGLTNSYAAYFTMPSEYLEQHYEGGSGLYGPYQGQFVVERLQAGDRLYEGIWDNKDPLVFYSIAVSGKESAGNWDKAEVAQWREHDPIQAFTDRCLTESLLTADDVATIERTADTEVADAVAYAEAGTLESVDTLTRHVVTASS